METIYFWLNIIAFFGMLVLTILFFIYYIAILLNLYEGDYEGEKKDLLYNLIIPYRYWVVRMYKNYKNLN